MNKTIRFSLFLTCTCLPFCTLGSHAATHRRTHTTQQHANMHTMQTPFNGLYGSLGAGISSTQLETNNSSYFTSNGSAALIAKSIASQTEQNLSAIGEVAVGYGHVFPSALYLGALGFADFANHKNTLTLNLINHMAADSTYDFKSTSTKFNLTTGGVALEPGFLVAPQTLFYGTLGWENANQTLTASQSVYIALTSFARGQQTASHQRRLNGLRVGFGFRQQVSQSVTLGLHYVYTDFFRGTRVSTPAVNTTGVSQTGPFSYTAKNLNLSTQAVLADFSYYWGNRAPLLPLPKAAAQGFNGVYFAPQIGALNPSMANNTSVTSTNYFDRGNIPNQVNLTTPSPEDTATTLLGFNLGAGGVLRNWLYLAVEAGVNWTHHSAYNKISHGYRPSTVAAPGQRQDLIENSTTLRFWDFEPNLDLRVGLVILKRLLGYVKVGIAVNDIRLNSTDNFSYVTAQGGNTTTVNLNENKVNEPNKTDLRLGAGFEFQFRANNTFSLNYVHTDYGTLRVSNSKSIRDITNSQTTLSNNTTLSLTTHTVTIGYSHYF